MKKITLKDLEGDKQAALNDLRLMEQNRIKLQGVIAYLNKKIAELKEGENG